MAGIDPKVWKLIQQGAKQRGLDPRAVGAVALSEGGLRYGAVGDAGTSFGPFQLHVGGALPRGRGASWANSPAGINYALNQIAKVAAGKTGRQAISHIVKRFERPADPTSEISRAWDHYQTLGGAVVDLVNDPVGAAGPPGTPGAPAPGQPAIPAKVIPQEPQFEEGIMGNRILNQFAQGGGRIELGGMPGIVESSWRTPPPVRIPGRPAVPGRPGTPSRGPQSTTGGTGGSSGATYTEGGRVQALPLSTKLPGGSEFGVADAEGAPSSKGGRYHAAKDWFSPGGSGVFAPEGGKVVEVRASSGNSGQVYGGTVKIQTQDGRVWVFRHVNPAKFKEGQRVKAGQRLASVVKWADNPKSSHAHIELWKSLGGGYNFENMLDPMEWFKH